MANKPRNPLTVSESPSIIAQYTRDLNRIVRKMSALVRELVYPVLKKYNVQIASTKGGTKGFQVADDAFGLELANAYNGLIAQMDALTAQAQRIATNRLTQANQHNRRAFITAWKKAYGVNVSPLLPKPIRVYGRLIDKGSIVEVNRAIRVNVELIKSIPKQHLSKIQIAIEKGLATGGDDWSLKELIKSIEGIDDQTKRRAKLIARDQLQKLNGTLNQVRQQDLGVNGYIWRTSADERVRESHRDNDGKRFQWDKPPSGTGHPGEDINCRCVAEPDLSQLIPSLAPDLQKFGPKKVNRISV